MATLYDHLKCLYDNELYSNAKQVVINNFEEIFLKF